MMIVCAFCFFITAFLMRWELLKGGIQSSQFFMLAAILLVLVDIAFRLREIDNDQR